ncbi:MAG: tRNA-uridine aminocarboxypropyltransferase [Opitutales bacterium]
MNRATCYRCFRPAQLCCCAGIVPMPTRTRFVFLMHPKEFKHEKTGTGRLVHLCLPNSRLHMGLDFGQDPLVAAWLADPQFLSVLLYPGAGARNLSAGPPPPDLATRPLQVFILDATWSGARKMLRVNPRLQQLPRIMFTPSAPSRFLIKQQPQAGCLSTLEAVHELLGVLAQTGLDTYPQPQQLLDLFDRMQRFQMDCAADPNRGGYRRQPYSQPGERTISRGHSANRRRYLKVP